MSKTSARHQALQEFLSARGYATIEELARHFEVTPQTVRKDINALAEEGKVQRFHGGAGMVSGSENIVYDERKGICQEEKRRIGALLATHIPDGVSVCINIGTTTEEAARALLEHKNLRVVTNSINVASICARNSSFDVVVACGTVRHRDNGIVGASAERFIREFRVDYGIIGISGIDEEGNLLDYDYREVAVARTIIECSRRVFLVTDRSKFGRPAMVRVAHLSDINALFTDGPVDKKWADRLMFGFTYSNMYQDVQTGVRQDIVYGQKHRKGHSLMPSLEYNKRNLFAKGLDVVLTVNYNKNLTTNVDTASYKYNWYGERKPLNSPGEQSYQHSRADNNNWNGTFTANYRLGRVHTLTFNHVLNAFSRSNTSLLAKEEQSDAIAKETRKNISGLSYRLMPSEDWNLSVFGKYYNQFVAGPVATDANQNDYVRTTRSVHSVGYGAAGTYFILPGLQAKLSYEKAYRLPTIEEMFGNEDLEMGDIGIRPENSDNINLNLSYNKTFGKHSVYVEGGFVYRNTKDYIQRNITDLSGGKSAATYVNYGKVLTKGYNISARYGFGRWLSVGGNFTQMNVCDNMKTSISGSAENIAYKERMPNLPYIFADSDVTFYWRDLWKKGNALTVSYDNQYLHSFTYYSSKIGSNKGDYVVPSQFSHNLSLSYSLRSGRYNLSFECRNFTDEQLYDNFSLQKAGRAFYGKVRVYFGN